MNPSIRLVCSMKVDDLRLQYVIIKDTLKAFSDFKNKQQKCMK